MENSTMFLGSNNRVLLFMNDVTGYIGIGNSNPSHILDVNGSINVLGYCNLFEDSFSNSSTNRAPTSSALSNVYAQSTFGSNTAYAASNTAIFGSNMAVYASNTAYSAVNDNLPLSGGTMTGTLFSSNAHIVFASSLANSDDSNIIRSLEGSISLTANSTVNIIGDTSSNNDPDSNYKLVSFRANGSNVASSIERAYIKEDGDMWIQGRLTASNMYLNSNLTFTGLGTGQNIGIFGNWLSTRSKNDLYYVCNACNLNSTILRHRFYSSSNLCMDIGQTQFMIYINGSNRLFVGNGVCTLSASTNIVGTLTATTFSNLPNASTTIQGIVQLDDTVTSTSTTVAPTANAVKTAYDFANTANNTANTANNTANNALPKAGGTMTGDISLTNGTHIYAGADSASLPTYSWTGATNQGIYRDGAATCISSDASQVFSVRNSSGSCYAEFGSSLGATYVYLMDITNASWALSTNGYRLSFNNNSTGTYASSTYFLPTGACYSLSFNDTSDDRIKINETIISDGLTPLMKLRPQIYDKLRSFEYAYDDNNLVYNSNNDVLARESGFIAQEVFYDCPELRHIVSIPKGADSNMIYNSNIHASSDPREDPLEYYKYWGSEPAAINYSSLIPYIVAGIQQQQKNIDELSATNVRLQQQIDSILARL